MELPQYVTADEVKRVCKELHIRDWTKLTDTKVLPEEARAILKALNVQGMDIALEDFQQGLEVELEHGTKFPDANVTNNHPILTGKIVFAHFKESMEYYQRLDVAEIEGDVLKAVLANDAAKLQTLCRKLSNAKLEVQKIEAKRLG
jgi:hypothetical protein